MIGYIFLVYVIVEIMNIVSHNYFSGITLFTGTLQITRELEKTTARFIGKPDALVFGMGFGTNSTNIPALMGKVTYSNISVLYCKGIMYCTLT